MQLLGQKSRRGRTYHDYIILTRDPFDAYYLHCATPGKDHQLINAGVHSARITLSDIISATLNSVDPRLVEPHKSALDISTSSLLPVLFISFGQDLKHSFSGTVNGTTCNPFVFLKSEHAGVCLRRAPISTGERR